MSPDLEMESLRQILAEKSLMPVGEISDGSDLFLDLELDSLCFLEVLASAERRFGIEVNPAMVPQAKVNTPVKLLAVLRSSPRRAPKT